MFIATILSKTGVNPEAVSSSYIGKTLEEAARSAEKAASAARKASPPYNYRVVVGKITHAVKPPDEKIDIVAVAADE